MSLNFKRGITLANFSTFKVGGPADYFIIAKYESEIIEALTWVKKKKLPFFVLGGGSNVLFSDEGFRGLVIKLQNNKHKIQNVRIIAKAGCLLQKLVQAATDAKLSGLEWAAGIPGTLGGAIRGNAGAFGGEMKNLVEKVKVLDVKSKKLKVKKLSNKECKFGYRESIFKKNKNWIILEASLKLKKDNKNKIQKKISEVLKQRKEKQPLEFPSAGSIFKNVPLKNVPKIVQEKFKDKIKNGFLPTAVLIEAAGLKGTTIGGAKISEKHANFIVNFQKARAQDVESLIKIIKSIIEKKFFVVLEEEIQLVKNLN